jgi:cytochrome c oxidase cbb3-type subunit III
MLGDRENSLATIARGRSRIASHLILSRELWPSRKAGKIRQLLRIASFLLAAAAATTVTNSQTSNRQGSAKQITKIAGDKLFEARCAACHGLDGRGGEHAPSVVHASSGKLRSDSELFQIICDGLVAKGMPAFRSLGNQKIRAVVGHLRFLQGKTATWDASGDPVHGKELFEGKGGCAGCHTVKGSGSFVSTDLSDFASNHDASEIRDAILNPRRVEGPGHTAAIVTTIAGDRYSGLIRNENNSSLQIQDAEGRFYLFAKSSLRSIERSAGPVMPVNYQQQLSKKEIEDLVSYIAKETLTSKFEVLIPPHTQ